MKANNILQFSASNNEKLEPIIDSDYFGSEKFDLLGLLETIEKLNIKQGKKMGYGVHSNSYQGDYKRVLTVCSANMLRSPTMAHVLASTPYDYNTRSAGTHSFALIPVTEELLFWADEIVCADTEHAKIVSEKLMSLNLDKPVVNLRIPDNYEYRDAGLILMIRRRYDEIMLSTKQIMPILNNPFGALGTYHIPVNSSGSGGTLSATISGMSFSPVSPEYAIQGKMITVDIVYTGADMERLGLTSVPNYFEDTIKKDLILKLAHSMARDNYIEFTKQMDSLEDVIRYRARIYATPDDKVRYLRIKGVI